MRLEKEGTCTPSQKLAGFNFCRFRRGRILPSLHHHHHHHQGRELDIIIIMATPTTTTTPPPKPDPRASFMTVKRSGGIRRSSVLRLDGLSNKIIDSNSTLPTDGMDRTGSFQDGYMSMSGHGGGGSLTGNSSHHNEPSASSLTGTGVGGGAYSTRLQFPAKIYGREKELKFLKNIYYQKYCESTLFADDGTATLDYRDLKSKSSTNVEGSKGKNSSDNDGDQREQRPGGGPILEDMGESIASIQALADQIESTLDRAFDESTEDDAPAENDNGSDGDGDDGEPQPSCILIGGYSGSGKTALVYSFASQINVEYSKVQKRLSQQSKQQHQQQDGKSVVSSATNESSKSTEELETNIKPCYFLTGKYENTGVVGGEPFSALLDAFGGYCDALIDEIEEAQFVVIQAEEDAADNQGREEEVSDEDQKKVDAAKKKIEELVQFQKDIKDALKEEVTLMMNFVPGLRDFLEVTTDGKRNEEEDEEDQEETTTEEGKSPVMEELSFATKKDFEFHKMAYVFKSFIKAICRASYPIILFLDDVQWIDDASLRLVSDIVKDKRIKGLLVVGCFRSNEVDDDHPVSKTLLSHHSVERLDLPDLTLEQVGRFVADTLRLEVDECYTLTETIHNKTQGNIFFAKAAMEQFQEKKALYVSMNTMVSWGGFLFCLRGCC